MPTAVERRPRSARKPSKRAPNTLPVATCREPSSQIQIGSENEPENQRRETGAKPVLRSRGPQGLRVAEMKLGPGDLVAEAGTTHLQLMRHQVIGRAKVL